MRVGKIEWMLSLLGGAAFIVNADARVIDPLLHIIADDFNTSVGNAGLIVTAYAIPYGLFQLVYGQLGDCVGKLKIITAAMAIFAIGTAVCMIAPSIKTLVLLRFFTGAVAAAIVPLSIAMIGDYCDYHQRQIVIGKYLGAIVLGQIFGSAFGGIFGHYLSWRQIFLLIGIISIVIFCAILLYTKEITNNTNSTQGKKSFFTLKYYYQIIKKPIPRLIIFSVFAEGFCLLGGFTYTGAFLRDRYHLSYVIIGFVLSGFGIGGFLYSLSVKWLVQKFGENGLILLGGWLICSCYCFIAFFHTWIVFIPASILMGLGFYMLHSTLQTQATELLPAARGAAVSLFTFSLFAGQGIGSAIFGRLVDALGYDLCFAISGFTTALLANYFVIRSHFLKNRS